MSHFLVGYRYTIRRNRLPDRQTELFSGRVTTARSSHVRLDASCNNHRERRQSSMLAKRPAEHASRYIWLYTSVRCIALPAWCVPSRSVGRGIGGNVEGDVALGQRPLKVKREEEFCTRIFALRCHMIPDNINSVKNCYAYWVGRRRRR